MKIENLFQEDINRKIQGVVQVEQNDVLYQEMNEYVVTNELKTHFTTFFNNYNDSFTNPNTDVGVWITGFFGSGKSHFLKMLAYLLQNKELTAPDGKIYKPVEIFRKKFADDPGTFMLVDTATKATTEAILFNIGIEGGADKAKDAILTVFAKTFYNHLGFYGNDLKAVELEKYVSSKGKYEEFKKVFEKNDGQTWEEARESFFFEETAVVQTLQEVLGMTEETARSWFNKETSNSFSIKDLVQDIKKYVDSKPDNFRLLFMVDEVGQYVGTDRTLLLDLQSFVEEVGNQCKGKVWVMCTGQEALDELIKTRTDEFSRIQARFYTRLTLSSTSVDEVVQERILKKKKEVEPDLKTVYSNNESTLRNLFTFSDTTRKDIKGYTTESDFVKDFPFVPYQFVMTQQIFDEIRKHGNAGKHQSKGERSMLSGFQETAIALKERDEFTLAPFYMFYDSVHSFLDSSIRLVIERCNKAAENHDGIEKEDVNVLKLLYLIRYINDIPATVDNLVILMADNIMLDKINKRKEIQASLDRLLSQNYIGRAGDKYNFLTDEEQDIQKDIKNTQVDRSTIITRIGEMLFSDIYPTKKFRHGKYDFTFEQFVDDIAISSLNQNGLRMKVITIASDESERNELTLMGTSAGRAVIVLSETSYYENLEKALKIRNYAKTRNPSQLPQSIRDIITKQTKEAETFETNARSELIAALQDAKFYVNGQHISISGSTPKEKIDNTLEQLVGQIYKKLDLINVNADSDNDIISTLNGSANSGYQPGFEPNREAADEIYEYLEMQAQQHFDVHMSDIQSRFSGVPYGWNEIDIANAVARLIYEQKITVKYNGSTIQADNSHLPDFLRKKSEIGKTSILLRQNIDASSMKVARAFLRDYFGVQDIPEDEDGVVKFISEKFTERKNHYEKLNMNYSVRTYPDQDKVNQGILLCGSILSQVKDNTSLIARVIQESGNLLDNKEDLINVENFFESQQKLFDCASDFYKTYKADLEYLKTDAQAYEAMQSMETILTVTSGVRYIYKQIPQLNTDMSTVKSAHTGILAAKRKELTDLIEQCISSVKDKAAGNDKVSNIVQTAEDYFTNQKNIVSGIESIALLDSHSVTFTKNKDSYCQQIDLALAPASTPAAEPNPSKKINSLYKSVIFQAKILDSEQAVDDYVEALRIQLKNQLKGFDAIELK